MQHIRKQQVSLLLSGTFAWYPANRCFRGVVFELQQYLVVVRQRYSSTGIYDILRVHVGSEIETQISKQRRLQSHDCGSNRPASGQGLISWLTLDPAS